MTFTNKHDCWQLQRSDFFISLRSCDIQGLSEEHGIIVIAIVTYKYTRT